MIPNISAQVLGRWGCSVTRCFTKNLSNIPLSCPRSNSHNIFFKKGCFKNIPFKLPYIWATFGKKSPNLVTLVGR